MGVIARPVPVRPVPWRPIARRRASRTPGCRGPDLRRLAAAHRRRRSGWPATVPLSSAPPTATSSRSTRRPARRPRSSRVRHSTAGRSSPMTVSGSSSIAARPRPTRSRPCSSPTPMARTPDQRSPTGHRHHLVRVGTDRRSRPLTPMIDGKGTVATRRSRDGSRTAVPLDLDVEAALRGGRTTTRSW